MLDLKALAIFVRVAERRSFVRSARELGMTQSGVSTAVSRLEDQLGVELLVRTTRSVNLTEHGAALLERGRQVLADLDEAEQVLASARLTPRGRLRIDVPVCFGRIRVVPLLGAFRAQYPQIQVAASFTDRYVDLVEEGVDLAIRLGPLQDSTLVARRLTGSRFRVVASPDYFARHGRPRSLDDIARHNCLAFTLRETRGVRAWRFRRGDEDVNIVPAGDMSFSDAAALAAATVAGFGLAQMRDYYTDDAIAAGVLEPVLEKFKPAADQVSLVYPQSRHLSPKVRVFIDFMAAAFR
jgi:DNA-binding transcriptional LysR family regulator